MLAAAARMLGMGTRILQAIDAQLQEKPVFVGKRVVAQRIRLLRAQQRNPVATGAVEEREPVVEPAGIQQCRLLDDEIFRGHYDCAAWSAWTAA
jgi:hypothetical protein